mgnify:CR=1 FL=1
MRAILICVVPIGLAAVSCGERAGNTSMKAQREIAPPSNEFTFCDTETWSASNEEGDASLLLVSSERARFSQRFIAEDHKGFVTRYTSNVETSSPSGGLERIVLFLNETETECYAVKMFPKYDLISVLEIRPLSQRGAEMFIGQVLTGSGCYKINAEGVELLGFRGESEKEE